MPLDEGFVAESLCRICQVGICFEKRKASNPLRVDSACRFKLIGHFDIIDGIVTFSICDSVERFASDAENPLYVWMEECESEHQTRVSYPRKRNCAAHPRIFAQSSLFMPIPKDRPRERVIRPLVHLLNSCKMNYFGAELDELDRDVFMALSYFASKIKFGAPFSFYKTQLVSRIGIIDFNLIKRSLSRLHSGMISLEVKTDKESGYSIGHDFKVRLLADLEFDERSQKITCRFDGRLAKLFDNNQSVLIDLGKRAQLNSSLAKSLHVLVSSVDNTVQKYSLSWLSEKHEEIKDTSVSRLLATGEFSLPAYKIKRIIQKACEELYGADIIKSFKWVSDGGAQYLIVVKHPELTAPAPKLEVLA